MKLNHRKRMLILASALLASICAMPAAQISPAGTEEEPQTGGLYIITFPSGAEVYVNGRLAGISPCTVSDIAAGRVSLRVSRNAYYTNERSVALEAGGIKTVEFELRSREQVGHILVLVEPAGARIELDSEFAGRTPHRLHNLDPGYYRLRITYPGHSPLERQVLVETGRHHEVRGVLQEAPHGEKQDGVHADPFSPDVKPDAPEYRPPRDASEELAELFDPVRRALRQRRYELAADRLRKLTGEHDLKDHDGFYPGEIDYILSVKDVVETGYKSLRQRIGEKSYPLPLKRGVSFTGEVLDVEDDHIVMKVAGMERRVSLDDIHIERIIRLAAPSYPPARPLNQLKFAYLYIMESDFRRAEEQIQSAVRAAYDVTGIRTIMHRERLAAEREAERRPHLITEHKQEQPQKADAPEELDRRGTALLIDEYYGNKLPARIISHLENAGYELNALTERPGEGSLDGYGVYILHSKPVLPERMDARQVDEIISFVRAGGGLVVFCSPFTGWAANRNLTIRPLLSRFHIELESDEFIVSELAPPSHRRDIIPARRSRERAHVITAGITGYIPFPLDTPLMLANRPLLAGTEYVMARGRGISEIPLLAAGMVEQGRVAVFAAMPAIEDDDAGDRAGEIVLNTIRWASVRQ